MEQNREYIRPGPSQATSIRNRHNRNGSFFRIRAEYSPDGAVRFGRIGRFQQRGNWTLPFGALHRRYDWETGCSFDRPQSWIFS